METIGVYSEADQRARHVEMVDIALKIGGAKSADSYLRGDRILEAASKWDVDAIHPGYGFLSENADFVDLCEQNGI